MEGLGEELGEEKEGRPLVEAVAFVGNETAAAAGEGVFLEDCYFEASFRKAGCCGYSANSGACGLLVSNCQSNGVECGVAEAYQRQ